MLHRWILKYFISWNIQNTKQKNRETLSQFNSVLIVLNMMIDDGSIRMLLTFGTYMLWQQCLKEGLWVDFRTRMAPATPIPWHISEPTGFIGGCLNQQWFNFFLILSLQPKTVLGLLTQAWERLPMTLTADKNTLQFVRYFSNASKD